MTITAFPPLELADEHGLLCVGGDLEVDSLLLSYRSGIFPWPLTKRDPLLWFAPPMRALLFVDELRIPKSLRKERSKAWEYRIDFSCPEVIENCRSAPRASAKGSTWITIDMVKAYKALHAAGWCHSFETWFEGQLVGGLYGVSIGTMFAGESMFHSVSNASKLALWYLVEWVQERGGLWIDCQQLTPLLESFGAREVPRNEYMALLATATNSSKPLFMPKS